MCRIKFTAVFELTNIVPPKKYTRIHSVHKGTQKKLFRLYFLNVNDNKTKWAKRLWVKSTRR